MNLKSRLKKYLPQLASFLLVLSLMYFGVFRLGKLMQQPKAAQFLKNLGVWAPIIYILTLGVVQTLAPLGGSAVFLAGYHLFEKRIQIYGYMATFLSATANFWIARVWGREVVAKLAGKKALKKIDQLTQDYGIKSLLFLRVFQGHLGDAVSYAYGLTNMKFMPYFLVTVLAPIPWQVLWYTVIFRYVSGPEDFTLWFFITLVPFILLSPLVFKKN